jgi:hypothetical protein
VSAAIQLLEELTIVTPLGVNFRDASTRIQISDDLDVTLHPAGISELKRNGVVNRAGVFVFRNLPGMRDVESGSGDEAFWAAQTPRFDFLLEVSDGGGRFLPYAFPLKLPVRHLLTLPLFSAPSRSVPEAMGVIRAEIIDQSGQPAAWSVADAATELGVVRGMADARGQLMLPLPYPRPQISLGSPLHAGGPDVTAATWSVDLTVRYARRASIPARPDLDEALRQPIALTTRATLRFGQELTLAPLTITADSPL